MRPSLQAGMMTGKCMRRGENGHWKKSSFPAALSFLNSGATNLLKPRRIMKPCKENSRKHFPPFLNLNYK